MNEKIFLGIELGSTRIKAAGIDGSFRTVLSGDYTWKSDLVDGVWTYPMEKVWEGLRQATAPFSGSRLGALGVSAMMHGYLAFDEDWRLLTPFRTWQNTMTARAAAELSELFDFNIPQRWSIAHLYQAILDREEHVPQIAHITTLAGYVHFRLTGVNAVGIGEGSGIFPVDSAAKDYDAGMLADFDRLSAAHGFTRPVRELLPDILLAGESAGRVTEEGSALLDGNIAPGTPMCPPEGDAETGMTATNAVAPRTGNVSAGTSVFSMVVLEKPLSRRYPEVGIVCTPTGRDVAMVHCSNCTADINAWAGILREAAELFGATVPANELFTKLYEKSLEADHDCGGVNVFNYVCGESVVHMDSGCPIVMRPGGGRLTLANFMRAQLFSAVATLRIGMDILRDEGVAVDSLTGHGGYFKTPGIGGRYMASACGAPITLMESAGEGGAYGMALLACYSAVKKSGETLESFLAERVFASVRSVKIAPDKAITESFDRYMTAFRALLGVERLAASVYEK